MPRRATLDAALFFHDGEKHHRVDQTEKAVGFHVGIWWHDDKRIVAFRQPAKDIQTVERLVDSDLAHNSVWETARRELQCPASAEYFETPRGRVLLDTARQVGILYHGNATSAVVLKQLARLYGLHLWEAQVDSHYLTGEALEEFYRSQ